MQEIKFVIIVMAISMLSYGLIFKQVLQAPILRVTCTKFIHITSKERINNARFINLQLTVCG